MLKKFMPGKHRLMWFASALLILALVPAVIFIQAGRAAHASGGGGGGSPIAQIFPTQASPGTTINITGFNYPPNVNVHIFFQTQTNGVVTAVTDQGGFFNAALKLPNTYTPGVHYFVNVNSSTLREQILFTFTKPSVSLSGQYQQQPIYGAQAFVNGSGFTANETVDLSWNLGSLGTVKAGIAAADQSGFFFSTFTMPSLPFGVQARLVAQGRISGLSANNLVNESPALYASPNQGVVGTTVALNGGGFGSNESIKIVFQNTVIAHAFTSLKGKFTTSIVVPSNAQIGYQTNGIVASGKNSGLAASAFFEVEPNISINPRTGTSGTLITVHGSHFTPNNFAEILWVFPGSGGSGGNTLFLTGVSVNSHGTFFTAVNAPQGLISGTKYFVLVIDGQTGASNQLSFLAL
jgi:hypothetical protein